MAEPPVKIVPTFTFGGILFEGDAAKEMRGVAASEVQRLARVGRRLVQTQIRTRNGTGFTREHIVVKTRSKRSLRASIQMAPESDLPTRVYPFRNSDGTVNRRGGQPIKGSEKYPAERVPYIILAVLEAGRYGGVRTPRSIKFTGIRAVLNKGRWQSGGRRQRPLFMFRRTSAALRAKVPEVRRAILARFND